MLTAAYNAHYQNYGDPNRDSAIGDVKYRVAEPIMMKVNEIDDPPSDEPINEVAQSTAQDHPEGDAGVERGIGAGY